MAFLFLFALYMPRSIVCFVCLEHTKISVDSSAQLILLELILDNVKNHHKYTQFLNGLYLHSSRVYYALSGFSKLWAWKEIIATKYDPS